MDKIQRLIMSLELGQAETVTVLLTIASLIFVFSIIKRKLQSESIAKLADKKAEINENRKRRKSPWTRSDYPNGWYGIIESNKLNKNVATEAVICDKEVVVWRGENGVAYVADAYCPHLGAHLGVEGEVKGNCIQCPFHNWQFDGAQAGKLTCIPYSQKVIENIQLKMWSSVECNGFVWIWYHDEGQDPPYKPPTCPETLAGHVVTLSDATAYAHIQDIAENSADISHFNAVHGTLVPKKQSFLNSLLPITIRWSADWRAETGDLGHVAKSVLTVRYVLFGKWSLGQVPFTITQYGPGIAVVDVASFLGKVCVVTSNTPMGPMNTRSMQKAFCSNRAIQIIQLLSKFSLVDQMFRDIGIWNRQRPTATPTFSKEDATIKSYRKWYSQFYSSNSKVSAK